MVSKLADNTKLGGIVDSEQNYPRLQRKPDQLAQGAEDWQLNRVNTRCRANHDRTQTANGKAMGSAVEQSDLGKEAYSSMKVLTQVNSVENEGAS